VGIIAWQDLILATCFPLYYIVMRAERPILLCFLNVLTSLNDFIIKRIVFLFLVKYIASGTLKAVKLNKIYEIFKFPREHSNSIRYLLS
jgi:hypothetical protein